MKAYKFDYRAWFSKYGPQSSAEVIALWHALVAEEGFFSPYVRKLVRVTKEGWGVYAIQREGSSEPLLVLSPAVRDCLEALLAEIYCGRDMRLLELEEELYWQGSRR